MKEGKITFIDLFAGIGGIRLGFERAGCKCVWSNDHDASCGETYAENFGRENFVLGEGTCKSLRSGK